VNDINDLWTRRQVWVSSWPLLFTTWTLDSQVLNSKSQIETQTCLPHNKWMKTIQQDLKSMNLSMNKAIDVAQNRPLWRLMSTFGAMHSHWCMPEMNEWMNESLVTNEIVSHGLRLSISHAALATVYTYVSIHPYVTHWYCIETTPARITNSSQKDSHDSLQDSHKIRPLI